MGENRSMIEQRKETRFQSLAKVQIDGNKEIGLLKDISITGCRVECAPDVPVALNSRYELQIIPERVSNIDKFLLTGECRWIRVGGNFSETGFFIVESPKGKLFQRYVDYLSWRHSLGESITNDSDTPPVV